MSCLKPCSGLSVQSVHCSLYARQISFDPSFLRFTRMYLNNSMACAGFCGIRQTYTVLAHLRWAIKPENATVTAMCLEILGTELKPLKQAEAEGGLLPQVTLHLLQRNLPWQSLEYPDLNRKGCLCSTSCYCWLDPC